MQLFLLASLGGAIGAGARYLVNVVCTQCMAPGFPWATFVINITGSFLMGVVVMGLVPHLGGSLAWRTFLATGILGGFTTFSAFSLEAVDLMQRQQIVPFVVYVVGSVVLSLMALIAGVAVARAGFGGALR